MTWKSLFTGVLRNPKALTGACMLAIFVALALFAPWIAPYDPRDDSYAAGTGPSIDHWLGTTQYGEDILSQLIYGTQQSLLIAVSVGGLATVIAALIGVASAYIGNVADHVMSVLTDIFLVLPALPLLIVITSYVPNGGLPVMITVIALTSWAFGARQFRAQALSIRNREFLEAARIRGERTWYTIVAEILPTMTGLLIVNFLGAAIAGILAVAGLQFIGLGDVSELSWGTMMHWAENNEALYTQAALWDLAPGLCIGLLAASFTLLNYAFDEVSNPALRPPGRRLRRRGRATRGG